MNGRDGRQQSGVDARVRNAVPDTPLPASNGIPVVQEYALEVMGSFGLVDWSFGWDRARRRMGFCVHSRKRITLSRHFVARNSPDEIRDTVLHEIAHALVGPKHGHDAVWKAMCREVGCKPERCGVADMPEGRWRADCGCCGAKYRRHRRPRRIVGWFCRRCGKERGKLVWKQH
jgi:predicted SprT family Zn-dependent metalloprotease